MRRFLAIVEKIYQKIFINTAEKRAIYLKDKGYKIGNNCSIFTTVNFGSEPYLIEIGDNCLITEGVRFVTHDGGLSVLNNLGKFEKADKFGRIKIGNNVFIGLNTIIMPGVYIGDNCIIGAGSIVTKNIPSNSIACGSPARTIKSLEQYYMDNLDKVDFTLRYTYEEKKQYLINKFKINDNEVN